MKLEYRSPDTLVLSDRNPPSRTADWNMKDMNKSMETYGFIPDYAVSINPDGVVRKGHRRVMAAQRLQEMGDIRLLTIPCLVVDNGTEFAIVRAGDEAQKKLGWADYAYIYIRNPNDVPVSKRRNFDLFERVLGKKDFKERVKSEQMTSATIGAAKGIYRMCLIEDGKVKSGKLEKTYRDLEFMKNAYLLYVDNKLGDVLRIIRHEFAEGNIDIKRLMQCVDEQDPALFACVRR